MSAWAPAGRRDANPDGLRHPHIVFITGHGDIPSSVRAMRAGAVDFLTKPFEEADLMRAIHAALAQNLEAVREHAALDDLHRRLASLTPRERDVLPLIASGLLNKQAAAELGISEVTRARRTAPIARRYRSSPLRSPTRCASRRGGRSCATARSGTPRRRS